jgi:hypothetical protein
MLFSSMLIRVRSRLRETIFLEPMRVGDSHIELKIEIYENTDGIFTSLVLVKRVFLIEPAFSTGIEESECRGMYPIFVDDLFYDTSHIRRKSVIDAIDATILIIYEQLLKSGEFIEYLSDLEAE